MQPFLRRTFAVGLDGAIYYHCGKRSWLFKPREKNRHDQKYAAGIEDIRAGPS